MSDLRKQIRAHYEAKELPADKVEAILARGRVEAAGGGKVAEFPVANRSRWPRVLALAAALAVFAGLAAWWQHDARGIPFAAVSQRLIEFFATNQKTDPAPQDKEELRALLVRRGAPANFRIPASLLPLESAACQVFDVRGQNVYLACFLRADAGGKGLPDLVHLVVARRGDFRDAPLSAEPQFAEHDGWSFASWGEGDIAYTLATAAPLETLRPYVVVNAPRGHAAMVSLAGSAW